MTDWTPFGVSTDPIQGIQNSSFFSIGQNLTFQENEQQVINKISVNATAYTTNTVSYPLSNFGFGLINYSTGVLAPSSQYL
jgi:hypothetical protein